MIYKNYIEMREGMGQPGQRLLTATEKNWAETKYLVLVAATMRLLFFENYKGGPNSVIHYGPLLDFPHYNLTTSNREVLLYPPPVTR